MATGLAAGYGACAAHAARFLYPNDPPAPWTYVARAVDLAMGSSLEFRAPTGVSAVIARQHDTGEVSDFVALSNVCPHLGCKVFWESPNNRFFCPCHNGTFDRAGVATGGPPFKAKQTLIKFPLKLEDGLLFVQIPT